jgi:two-component system chemotaxis response regulator CheB
MEMDDFPGKLLKNTPEAPVDELGDTFFIVAIGASGGSGFSDTQRLLEKFPENLSATVLVVLHRPVDSVSYLSEALGYKSTLPVRVAKQGEKLKIRHCYIGEPGKHLVIGAGPIAKLLNDPENRYRNRTVDTLFYSIAQHGGHNIIGVVLSGSLDDGSHGLAAIQRVGGITMVLTPQEGADGGMPEHAIRFNPSVEFVGSVRHIAAEIAARVQSRRMATRACHR